MISPLCSGLDVTLQLPERDEHCYSQHIQTDAEYNFFPFPAQGTVSPVCYQCDDLSHLKYCDTVHQCRAGEVSLPPPPKKNKRREGFSAQNSLKIITSLTHCWLHPLILRNCLYVRGTGTLKPPDLNHGENTDMCCHFWFARFNIGNKQTFI